MIAATVRRATPEECHARGLAWLQARGWVIVARAGDVVTRVRDPRSMRVETIGAARAIQRLRDDQAQRRRVGCLCTARFNDSGHPNPACKYRRANRGAR